MKSRKQLVLVGAVALASALSVALLSGCSSRRGMSVTVPPERFEQQATSSPEAGGAHKGTPPTDVQNAVIAALKAYGMEIPSQSDLRMTYAGDESHVTVSGPMDAPGPPAPGGGKGPTQRVSVVEMAKLEGGVWSVTSRK